MIIDISDKIEIKNLKYKIQRLQIENDTNLKMLTKLKNENDTLFKKNLILEEENQELRNILKEFQVDITNER